MSNHLNADIIVVGAGLVGLSAAISLALTHKKVVLVESQMLNTTEKKDEVNFEQGAEPEVVSGVETGFESDVEPDAKKNAEQKDENKFKKMDEEFPQPQWDARVYALTLGSIAWLESIGVWTYVDKSRLGAINQMQLWANDSVEPLTLSDSDAHLSQLGLIIENANLKQALLHQINTLDVIRVDYENLNKIDYSKPNKITLFFNTLATISANVLVAADGVNSWVRAQTDVGVTVKHYNQTAIVANFLAEFSHQNSAKQWFKNHDTLALLPLSGRTVSMVWSVSNTKSEQLLSLNPQELSDIVFKHSRGVLGRLTPLGSTYSFALNQQTANHLIANRIVFLGDSAHQIHPMAGQGVNLGFRDVMQLQQLLTQVHTMQDIGEHSFLRRYERNRSADIAAINSLTSGLDWIFSREHCALNAGFNWGFNQINKKSIVKKLLIQAATA